VQSKVSVTAQDVERFYASEHARFVTPTSVTVKQAQRAAGTEEAWIYGDAPITLRAGQPADSVAGGQAALDAIFALEPGGRTTPLPVDGGQEVSYEVVAKTAGKTVPLEDVRGQLERELRQKKEQEQLESVIQSLIETHNVKLYPERLAEKRS
jgi:hypothetical protein